MSAPCRVDSAELVRLVPPDRMGWSPSLPLFGEDAILLVKGNVDIQEASVGYQIVTVPEVEAWLADVRDRDPAVADRIDAALAALRAEGGNLGPPLVVPVNWPLGLGGPRRLLGRARTRLALVGLDAEYRWQLTVLTRIRRAVAGAAVSRKRLELQISQLENETGEADRQRRLDALRREHTAARSKEERAFAASRRLQAEVAAFQGARDAIASAGTAVEEAARVARAQLSGDGAIQGDSPPPNGTGSTGTDGPAHPPSWLSELRPGAPESTRTRMLFTIKPPATAVLLAAGTESDWLNCWYAEIIPLCRTRLQREQSGADKHRT